MKCSAPGLRFKRPVLLIGFSEGQVFPILDELDFVFSEGSIEYDKLVEVCRGRDRPKVAKAERSGRQRNEVRLEEIPGDFAFESVDPLAIQPGSEAAAVVESDGEVLPGVLLPERNHFSAACAEAIQLPSERSAAEPAIAERFPSLEIEERRVVPFRRDRKEYRTGERRSEEDAPVGA